MNTPEPEDMLGPGLSLYMPLNRAGPRLQRDRGRPEPDMAWGQTSAFTSLQAHLDVVSTNADVLCSGFELHCVLGPETPCLALQSLSVLTGTMTVRIGRSSQGRCCED